MKGKEAWRAPRSFDSWPVCCIEAIDSASMSEWAVAGAGIRLEGMDCSLAGPEKPNARHPGFGQGPSSPTQIPGPGALLHESVLSDPCPQQAPASFSWAPELWPPLVLISWELPGEGDLWQWFLMGVR